MLGRQVNKALRITSLEQPWGDVLPLLLSADLRIVYLERAITDHEQPWARPRSSTSAPIPPQSKSFERLA